MDISDITHKQFGIALIVLGLPLALYPYLYFVGWLAVAAGVAILLIGCLKPPAR